MNKYALVQDWLMFPGGSERVLEAIFDLYPAPIYTLVHDPKEYGGSSLSQAEVKTSFIQKLPFSRTQYRNYLPFFPSAIERFDLSSYDVVISSSHAVAKGVLTHANQLHICYCHTPMRYIWDLTHHYFPKAGLAKGLVLHYLRLWDVASSNRVDHFVANSHYVARRIKKAYNREATVIYPPVDVNAFSLVEKKEEYYFTSARFVPYKKIDLVVEAFASMPHQRLVVIGDGPDWQKVKSKAKGNIELLGHQPRNALIAYMQKAKAFLIAAEEDFGIMPVEAQACGTPVIALGKGGSLETVIEGKTGIFFKEQTVQDIVRAVEEFEKLSPFDPVVIRRHAEQFSSERFKEEFSAFVRSKEEAFSLAAMRPSRMLKGSI